MYAFSNRAIRRAFRQVIFRGCCFCRTSSDQCDDQSTRRRTRAQSGSLTTDISQSVFRGTKSTSFDVGRIASKIEKDLDSSSFRAVEAPVVSFNEFLAEKTDDDEEHSPHADKQSNQECETMLLKEQQTSPSIS